MASLERRIFLEAAREPLVDPEGFVLRAGPVLSCRDLLHETAVLVAGPPWIGKTTVAQGLFRSLQTTAPFSCLTSFERTGGAVAPPPRWGDWLAGTEPAVWILDAVDEDARKERQCFRILQWIRELPPEARARLHLIAFCRINEIPPAFERDLEEIFGALQRLRLAGLDRETAREHVEQVRPGRFGRVRELLRANDLQPLAPYPAVLAWLAKREEGEALTQADVWEGVLKDLLREKRDDPAHPSFQVEIDERLRVARKLAALATFCGLGDVDPEEGLERAFPEQFAEQRRAVREAWRGALFERSDRGYRFCQDHVRQWLTALALREMTSPQLRPLFLLEDGQLDPNHEGVAGLLARISRHPEVKDWLVAAHGGLPEGDARWSLPEASRALDTLQELARTSPWGLDVWRQEGLRSFRKVPGLGAEIARRLELDLAPAEQQLLLDLAFVMEAPEPVAPAIRIFQETHGDERVRGRAASLVAALATPEQLAPLAEGGEAGGPVLEVAFYEKGLWSFEKAAAHALAGGDDWLQYRLADGLTLTRARWLLGSRRVPRAGHRLPTLWTGALETLLEQEAPEEADIALLVPLLLDQAGSPAFAEIGRVRNFLGKSPLARRALFQEGMARNPEGGGEERWIWHTILTGEDAAWLLDMVEAGRRPGWLLETLYFTSCREGAAAAVRRRVRKVLRAADAERLDALDRERRTWGRRKGLATREGSSPEQPEPEPQAPATVDLLEQARLLHERGGAGDHEALEALASRHPSIREWLADVRAHQGAESVIAGLGRGGRPPGEGRKVAPADLLRLLQSAEHRLLGSTDDLQDAVLEELQRIQLDARQHLAMLYRPQAAKQRKRDRLHEEALQAYLACRLADRLARVLGERGVKIEPSVDREVLAAGNTRNDLKIQAPSIEGSRLTVILEVKWSDNPTVATGLARQLGEDYLLRNGHTHGIYLVGWCGASQAWRERAACETEMAEQARQFGRDHEGRRIDAFVMDLTWKAEPAAPV